MNKFHTGSRPISVKPLPDYRVLVTYENNEEREFDIKPYLDTKPFDELRDIERFNKVAISAYKIEWRPLLDIDLEPLSNE
jgi:hypothetical protein